MGRYDPTRITSTLGPAAVRRAMDRRHKANNRPPLPQPVPDEPKCLLERHVDRIVASCTACDWTTTYDETDAAAGITSPRDLWLLHRDQHHPDAPS